MTWLRVPLARPALHAWFRWSRGLTLGVRAVVLDGQDRVCLVRHTYMAGWHLPGGGVEAGETAAEGLRRELAEEAGLEPVGEPRLHGIFHSGPATPRDHVLVYVVRTYRDLGTFRPGREIAAMAFFGVDGPPHDLSPGTRRRIDEVRTGCPLAPGW